MTTNRFRGILTPLVTVAMFSLIGCGGSPDSSGVSSHIAITPTKRTLYPGQSQQLTVTAYNVDGTSTVLGSGVSFSASAGSVATVSATGLVTGVGPGTGTVSASYDGKTADAVVKVTPLFPGPVFTDSYASGVSFAPFGGSTNALSVDPAEHHSWSTSLKILVPATGYTGGTLNASAPQNLSGYNAVTFWGKASKASTLSVAGFGDDASGNTRFKAETGPVNLTTEWAKFIVPIPAPIKLTENPALFHFAQGGDGTGYSIWLDDIQYEALPASVLGAPAAATVGWQPISVDIGRTATLPSGNGSGNTVTYQLPAIQLTNVGIGYFDIFSSAPSVALPGTDGTVTGLSFGTASLSAKLGALAAAGTGQVTVAVSAPSSAPPRPTLPQSDVISMLSKAYTNVPIDTWNTSWGVVGGFAELVIGGDDMKKYANLGYAGIEFTGPHEIDASAMKYFHIDYWTPDLTEFHIKLVDFGADTIYSPGVDDTAFEYVAKVTVQRQWVSLDIPLTAFPGMNFKHLAQMIPVGVPYQQGTVFIDNVYFHK